MYYLFIITLFNNSFKLIYYHYLTPYQHFIARLQNLTSNSGLSCKI